MSEFVKRERRHRSRLRLLIPVILIVLAVLGISYYYQFMVTEYDFSSRLSRLDIKTDISPMAKNLALVVEDDVNVGDITSESAFLAGEGGEAIASKVATKRMNPASTTKVMTALVALKYGNLEDEITVPTESVITEAGASLAGISPGDVLTLDELLYGLMLPSGNDAANAIAVHIGGSIENFVEMMNDEAKRIGAVDTHFVNVHGLTDPKHYTTAYDLYIIFNEALKDPRFLNYAGASSYSVEYTASDGSQIIKTWKNGNRYITGQVKPPEGVVVEAGKTGTTIAAGSCLVISSDGGNGNRYISVILKSVNKVDLYDNMSKLLLKIDK